MSILEEQKERMARNLERSFELLDTVLELRLAYLKKMHPDKTEAQLIRKIHLDVIELTERQWNLRKI